ncbi:MAG: signal peptide peptidase SppA [Chloroflexi bacterium]|nr:MAG: signal peptide peptidase SppA [Chloroflexota bacterium]
MILYPFRYIWWLLSSAWRSFGKAPDYVIFVLESALPTLPDPPGPFWQRFVSERRMSVKELGERFDAIARDPRMQGVVLHLRPVPMPMATLQDLRDLVAKLRAAGKRVVAWAPFYTTASYYVACACDEILLMPSGLVRPLGFASTGVFLADALSHVGIKADFIQVSPYKAAADPLTKSKMSPELREQVTWLLDSNHKELIRAVAASRGVDQDAAARLIDASPYADNTAIEQRIVDTLRPEEQLPDHLSKGGKLARIATWDQARRRLRAPRPSTGRGRYVAVMRIEGTIIDGRSGRLPVKPPIDIPLAGDDRAGDLTVVPMARQVAADKRAAAAVLFVNSRGGSATASEAMRQALELVAKRKPLVIAMGPVAGSGGYLVATPGQWIVARPGTLTGSIGVLTGKLVTSGLFSKLLVNRETVAFGRHVTLESDDDPFTDEERRIVQAEIDRTYELFLGAVAASRHMTSEQVQPIAGGRVWTGTQALERKLVDELGGLDSAIRKARRLAGLPETTPAREVRAPRKQVPPHAMPSAAGLLGYVLDGISVLSRAPALAVMEFIPNDIG